MCCTVEKTFKFDLIGRLGRDLPINTVVIKRNKN